MGLCVKELSFTYDKKPVLDTVSFEVPKKSITGLIGKNGAGKTTAILNMIQKLKPQKGTIYWNDVKLADLRKKDFPISYIPDEPVFYEELTVLEHLNLTKALYPNGNEEIDKLVREFELEPYLHKVPALLSKGTLQKMMIAIALLRQYECLIADEPITGLDPTQIYIFKKKMRELCDAGKGVLLSTHLLDIAEEICDRYVIIDEGKILAEGTRSDIVKKYQLPDDLNVRFTMEDIYLQLLQRERR